MHSMPEVRGVALQDTIPPPLPLFRVLEGPTFTFTCVDFAGPLYVKSSPPCKEDNKMWICLFICAVTGAVHLEVVADLSVSTYIRCLKRFVSRRGLPHKIVSDNEKTFQGAANVIKRIMEDPKFTRHLSRVGVRWQFNIEQVPWWGGMFECMISSTKRCLRKMIGQSKLSYDELNTMVIEVESIINSRPISYLSTSNIEERLTPSHLMIGRCIINLPDKLCFQHEDEDYVPNLMTEVIMKRMKYYATLNRFWKRWTGEYLLGLCEAHIHYKKRSSSGKFSVGDIVIVHNDKKPRGFWNLGKVEKTLPGRDGLVRSAVIHVYTNDKQTKLFLRLVQLLYPIEISSRIDSV